jgi:hypothetical protein
LYILLLFICRGDSEPEEDDDVTSSLNNDANESDTGSAQNHLR